MMMMTRKHELAGEGKKGGEGGGGSPGGGHDAVCDSGERVRGSEAQDGQNHVRYPPTMMFTERRVFQGQKKRKESDSG